MPSGSSECLFQWISIGTHHLDISITLHLKEQHGYLQHSRPMLSWSSSTTKGSSPQGGKIINTDRCPNPRNDFCSSMKNTTDLVSQDTDEAVIWLFGCVHQCVSSPFIVFGAFVDLIVTQHLDKLLFYWPWLLIRNIVDYSLQFSAVSKLNYQALMKQMTTELILNANPQFVIWVSQECTKRGFIAFQVNFLKHVDLYLLNGETARIVGTCTIAVVMQTFNPPLRPLGCLPPGYWFVFMYFCPHYIPAPITLEYR